MPLQLQKWNQEAISEIMQDGMARFLSCGGVLQALHTTWANWTSRAG